MSGELKQLREVLAVIVQTNGVANCFDRYCHDDEWTYCIFCEEGDDNPYTQHTWKHKPDCVLMRARLLLDAGSGRLPAGYAVIRWPMSFHPRYQGKDILIEGFHMSFDSEFEARLFCWQHAEERNH